MIKINSQIQSKIRFLIIFLLMSLALIDFSITDMAVWLLIVVAVFGLVFLCSGGEVLTRGAVALAVNLKIDPLVVGLTVVSIATSMPEFMASLMAAESHPGMALGNILGSNLANTGLILGVAALIVPLRVQLRLIEREVPILLGVTLLFGLFSTGGGFVRWEGLVLLGVVVLYLGYVVHEARSAEPGVAQKLAGDTVSMGELSNLGSLFAVCGGAVLLALGANWLVQSGAELAARMGVNEAFIGLTVLAVGTSLPELAASVSAVRSGQGDLCAGNILGSNLFNLLLIGGGVAVISEIPVESGLLRTEYFSLLLLSFLLFWFFKSGHTVTRKEGAGLLFLYFTIVSIVAFQQTNFPL